MASQPVAVPLSEPMAVPETGAAAVPDAEPLPDRAGRPVAPVQRRLVPALTVLLLVAAAAVVGYLVGHSGSRNVLASYRYSAAVNHLQLRYPSTWQLSAAPNVVPGMSFDSPLVLTQAGGAHGLTAGTVVDAGGPTLLSSSFLSKLQGSLPPAAPVRLGDVEAYRYTGVRVRGLAEPLTLYVAPTAAGVATIACWTTRGPDAAFQTDCGRIASTLRLLGTSAFALGPSRAFASLLATTFRQLHTNTQGPLASLGSATSAPAQATAARSLAGDYGAAASTIAAADITPAARNEQSAIVAALRRCASAYGAAAAVAANATKAGAASAFGSAGAALDAASTAVTQALRALPPLGYTFVGQR